MDGTGPHEEGGESLRDALFYWYRISYIAVLKTRFRPGVHGKGRRFVAVVIPICAWAD